MATLTALILAKNEERHISECVAEPKSLHML